jgi:hypothetical protein
MATLSGKTTSGELSFTKYVTNFKSYADTMYEIEKGMSGQLLIKSGNKYIESDVLPAGSQFNITNTDIVKIGLIDYAAIKYKNVKGFVPIAKIRKPTGGNGTAYEDEVVDALNEIFKQLKRPIDIVVGTKTYKGMTAAVKVDSALKKAGGASSDPKADIIICKDKKNPLGADSIYISHKKAGGPEAFQQYGGLTDAAGPAIAGNKEVLAFLEQTSRYVKKDKLSNPLMKSIKDKKLINMSIYGPDYGGKFSLQHTQIIGQGLPKLTQVIGDKYKLTFTSHMSLSGDLSHFTGGYTPVFGATFRAGRGFNFGNKRINGVRVGIYPKKLIEGRSELVNLK